MVTYEEGTETMKMKDVIISKTHISRPSCVEFYKLILNKKNVPEEIHSSDKYSTFMENMSDCNKHK
jgi:hypothetical protein